MDSIAEEFKISGNKAFSEKKYEDAIILYTKAIETDPTNFIYYNNRAAAHHELKNYSEAIQDAKKSIIIKNNAKAHARIATALWAQAKLEEAKVEYKHSLALDANNENVKNSIKILDQMLDIRRSSHRHNPAEAADTQVTMDGVPLPPLCGGEFTPAPATDAGAVMAMLVLIFSFLFMLSYVLKSNSVVFFWRCLMCMTVLDQGLNIYLRGMIPRKVDDLKALMRYFSPLLLTLCGAALLLAIPSQLILGFSILVYALVDLLNHKNILLTRAQLLRNVMLPCLDYMQRRHYHLLLIAASFEALLIIPIMLSSGALFTIFYIQYIKTRYVYDRYVQVAFANLRQKVSNVTSAPFMPRFVNEYTRKFFDMLYALSQQGI